MLFPSGPGGLTYATGSVICEIYLALVFPLVPKQNQESSEVEGCEETLYSR